jgi:ATP-dependent Clp protease ATP-binding subunit ClpA
MTVKAQEALQQADDVAARHENQQIEPVHLLAARVANGRRRAAAARASGNSH